jgi:hypothetical protein
MVNEVTGHGQLALLGGRAAYFPELMELAQAQRISPPLFQVQTAPQRDITPHPDIHASRYMRYIQVKVIHYGIVSVGIVAARQPLAKDAALPAPKMKTKSRPRFNE